MGFMEAVRHVLSNYATFTGRAQRSEYWWFVAFSLLVGVACSFVDGMLGTYFIYAGRMRVPMISSLLSLAFLIPSLSVLVRRLHDSDKSGFWYFIMFVPVAGVFILFYLLVRAGTPGDNRFGPSPKATPAGVHTTVRRDSLEASAPTPPVGVTPTQKRPVPEARPAAPLASPAKAEPAGRPADFETCVPGGDAESAGLPGAKDLADMVTEDVIPAASSDAVKEGGVSGDMVTREVDEVPVPREMPVGRTVAVPQPSAPRMSFAILAVAGPLQGQAYPIPDGGIIIGRERTCAVVFPESTPGVSARHCEMAVGESGPALRDLGSTYGTYVGGRKVAATEVVTLAEGDTFWLGTEDNRFSVIVFSA